MVHGYALLYFTSLLAALVAFVVLLLSAMPNEAAEPANGEGFEIEILLTTSGANTYVLNRVPPPAYAKLILLTGTCLFLAAVFVFAQSTYRRTHSGVQVPVSRFEASVAQLVTAGRPFLLGKSWEATSTLPDAALDVAPSGGLWTIELTGAFGDIREELTVPKGRFAQCEEIESYDPQSRCFRVSSTEASLFADCRWLLLDYLGYSEDTLLDIRAGDASAFHQTAE